MELSDPKETRQRSVPGDGQYGSVFDVGLFGVCCFATDGTVIDANEYLLDLLGCNRLDLRSGESAVSIRLTELAGRLAEARLGGKPPMPFEQEVLRKDGGRITVLFGGAIIDERSSIGFALDLTERKRAEAEHARLIEVLEETIRSRDDVLSVSSHDLKGPLTALRLKTQGLLRSIKLRPDAVLTRENMLNQIDAIDQQVRRTVVMLDELLDASRIAAGRVVLDLEETDLAAVVVETANRFGDQLAQVGSELQLRTDGPIVGLWDRLRVEQIVANLLSNAIKYGAGEPVEIELDADSSTARVLVRDHGIGIAPEDQKRIFRRFERVASRRKE
ncbi:MAG: PAS domain-containing sensor histidine kinase, partial [Pseudomonadota bacterium]